MATVKQIVSVIDEIAPFSSAMEFDNVGLLVGDENAEVSVAVLALDITKDIIEEARQIGAQLIISHHPVIFNPLKTLLSESVPYELAKHGISAICAHTNLDIAPKFGVNAALTKRLELDNIHTIKAEDGFTLTCGDLEQEKEPEEFAQFVKEKLQCRSVKMCVGEKTVRKVAVCGGAGGEYISFTKTCGADAYVTGEMKYHEMLEAAAFKLTVIEAGHYETEKFFEDVLREALKERIKEVIFLVSRCEEAPMVSI